MHDNEPNEDLIEVSNCIAQMNSYLNRFNNNNKAKYFYNAYYSLGFNQGAYLRLWMKKVYAECSSFIFTMNSIKESDIKDGILFIDDYRLKFDELQYTYFLCKLFHKNIAYACEEYKEDLRLIE